jgi:hypothetical protein
MIASGLVYACHTASTGATMVASTVIFIIFSYAFNLTGWMRHHYISAEPRFPTRTAGLILLEIMVYPDGKFKKFFLGVAVKPVRLSALVRLF